LNQKRVVTVPFLLDNLIWILLLVTIFIFSILTSRFLGIDNLTNILVHSSVLGILVIGQSFTLITGNFDLSAESTIGLTAVLGAFLLTASGEPSNGSGLFLNPVLTILVMLAVGLFIGEINGFLVTKMRMNNFVVTLSMLIIVRGLAFLTTQGRTVTNLPVSFKVLGHGLVGPVPISVIVMAGAFLIAAVVTRSTRFGRDLYTIGGNREAAVASGIDPDKRVLQVYLISGALAAVGAWIQLGRLGVAPTSTGQGMIFEIQAAAVIGGISLFGGRGTMIGALGGVLLLSSIDSGLSLMRVSGFAIDMVRGIIILVAMLLDAQKARYRLPANGAAKNAAMAKG
jgi:ribose/xylose/arabinose/galactoside ABC-type transport system permease subunit